jgi:hypothetical protein
LNCRERRSIVAKKGGRRDACGISKEGPETAEIESGEIERKDQKSAGQKNEIYSISCKSSILFAMIRQLEIMSKNSS